VPATIFLFLFPLSLSLSPLVQLSSLSPRLRMENGQVFRILTLLARGFRFLVTLLFWSSPLSKFSLFLRRRGVGCCFLPFAVRPFCAISLSLSGRRYLPLRSTPHARALSLAHLTHKTEERKQKKMQFHAGNTPKSFSGTAPLHQCIVCHTCYVYAAHYLLQIIL